MYPFLKCFTKFYFKNPFYEAEENVFVLSGLFSQFGSQLLPTPQSHVLTEWAEEPVEGEIPF